MANKKVSQLTSKPSVLTTDLFPIADPSTGQLFKTTISDLGTAIGSGVSSVNGLVGAVVLDTDDIQELVSPTNKWFTDTRARAALSASSPLTYNSGTGVFGIQVANGSQNGYLSSADWTTFNDKMPAITFNSPLFIASGGDVGINLATTSSNGYLSSTDWNTFNNKVGGSGTNTYLAMFSASNTLTSSAISYNGSKTTVEAQGLVSLNGLELQGAYNSVSGLKLLSNDSTTGYSYMEFSNTGGGFRLGVNRNTAGGILSGSATYATFLTTTGATSLQLGANGALILSLNTSGLARFYNQVQIDNTVTATQFIRSGGTSSQFLKADGSVDSSTYLTTGTASSTYLPLSGGTLTGALSGTSATFSGAVVVASPFTIKATNPYIQWKNSSDTRLGYIQHATDLVMTADSGNIILNTTSGTFTLASSGAATFSSSVTATQMGIGVSTLPSWTGARAIQAGLAGSYYGDGQVYGWQTGMVANAYRTGVTTWAYQNTGIVSTRVEMSEINPFSIFIAPSGTAGNTISYTQALTLNSSGNVGIGTTSPSGKLHVVGSIYQSDASSTIASNRFDVYNGGATTMDFNYNSAGGIKYIASGTLKMQLTGGGDCILSYGGTFVAYTQTSGTYGMIIQNLSNNTSATAILFRGWDGSTTGSITTYVNLTSYNMTSDYRLKEDLKPINGLDIVNKINVYDYKWKADNSRMNGVLAHELQEVLPYAVTGIKDGKEMQQVDYSKIVPVMVQAIKEEDAKIITLQNKVKELEIEIQTLKDK